MQFLLWATKWKGAESKLISHLAFLWTIYFVLGALKSGDLNILYNDTIT